jgi:hypothetical protein
MNMNDTPFQAPTLGIGRLLREGSRFFVPHHQRDYSWTEDEIEQLFSDIQEARAGGQGEYFIGLMVFMPGNPREYIILDGQQRLATTVIVLASIRSWLNARGFDRDAHQIQSDYVAVRELGSELEQPRLILNENNNPYFKRFVVGEAPSSDIERELKTLKRYDASRRLLQATQFCRGRIDQIVADGNGSEEEAAQSLFGLVRYLEDSVKIVRLTVPSEANAYTVFETLNDRGLDLTVLDLVKNCLFGKAGSSDRLRDVQARWAQMMATLSNVRADDFLKAWWTSRFGRVQTAQLFPRFKNLVNSWPGVENRLDDMLLASEHYAALGVADDPVWADLPLTGSERVRSLKLLDAKQVHPVLLSALKKFSVKELERLLKLLEVLIVRYQLIGGGRTGRLEITAASLASQIWDGRVKTTKEAFKVLKDILPSDLEFRESFRTKQERSNQKASWILARLEIQARRSSEKGATAQELVPSGSLTLEHVLPRNPGAEWTATLGNDPALAEDCTFRLGNMCLLSKVNRDLGNKAFEEKKVMYGQSDLVLTREMAGLEDWNRAAVERRQDRLAKLAVALWRYG